MQTFPKFPKFKSYACAGDSVSISIGSLVVTARLEDDCETTPDHAECYTPEQIAAWKRDEWRFVGVVLSVRNGDTVIGAEAVASLWAIECNFPVISKNGYLSECADEMLEEALQAAAESVRALHAEVLSAVEQFKTLGL